MPSPEKDDPAANQMIVALTTVASREQAEHIARTCIDQSLAACVQIDSPSTSIYQWKGETQEDSETRVWFKAIAVLEKDLKQCVFKEHPYDTPQWIVFEAKNIDEKYLIWAKEVSNLRGFL